MVHWSVQTEISHQILDGWIPMEFNMDVHVSQRMNPDDFGDPLTFPLMPPVGYIFLLILGNILKFRRWIDFGP